MNRQETLECLKKLDIKVRMNKSKTGVKLNLVGENLRGADLVGADLSGADLRRANLREANLREANLRGANLGGVDLRDADLGRANLIEAKLRLAFLKETKLIEAKLIRADLREANLGWAKLTRADLREADLSGANLTETDLSEAILVGANFAMTNIHEALYRGAYNLDEAAVPGRLWLEMDRQLEQLKRNVIPSKPLWRSRDFEVDDNLCFVLMPLSNDPPYQHTQEVFHDSVKLIVESFGLSCKRADDFFRPTPIMEDIWTQMCKARLLIADCTGRNPNVFYEVGIAHTLGKPVILITQNTEDVPFDLRMIRYIKYTVTPRGIKDFEDALRQTIGDVIGRLPSNEQTLLRKQLILMANDSEIQAELQKIEQEFTLADADGLGIE